MKPITGYTKLACLLGSPVAHSKSPSMYNEAFSQLDLDFVYLAFDVQPEELPTFMSSLRIMDVKGLNVTMPNKTAACKLCDKLSPAAQIIGSVNAIVNNNGIFIGHNTDGIGFMRALHEDGCETLNKKMTILGAGGAGTSIFVQAALDGVAEITIFSRRGDFFDRAEKIIQQLKEYSSTKINLYDFDNEELLRKEIKESSILVNATSVGMAPNADNSLITDPSFFHKDLFVSDIIYNPEETVLLRLAKEAGCRTQNGLYMLLYQGAEAFKLWTGQEMPVDIIKEKYFS